ncbi:Rieske (2Fe-2S) protein [Halieaceae bacterium IMCC8485]|uniref:Rieske (2Fe-2S) protein n=1 Tax=Candidatus Seongchinamella marina TaxID=2518990 RepID=A0ABT3SZQ3_9GAMM|nr:aromatic ring-hydroxylating dioxygenase subunit alpha [Candidatus Seongchinamella marina]MCX2975491.1 Rieske (2Fe-2S) protein [Candidatus Seongchinamella marina]
MTVSNRMKWPENADHTAVPYYVFHDQDIYNREQDKIYNGPAWHFVALEAELLQLGSFKSTYIGDTPVVVTRGQDNEIYAWVNRCAHRGAEVCRHRHGVSEDGTFTCVYHQWAYDAKGDLRGVPFQRGLAGKGGYPKDFDKTQHGLRKVKVVSYCGAIFGTFSDATPDIETYMGEDVSLFFKRIMNRPVEVLGTTRQYIKGNWKFYAENSKDPYHASLLHLFHATFGLYRSSQEGATLINNDFHTVLWAKSGEEDEAALEDVKKDKLRTYQAGTYTLNDPSLLVGQQEFDDGISLVILTLFPSLVLQQIQNTLAVRQILPKGKDEFELVWTYFGYTDDSEELRNIRLKQLNLIGPAGLISMEDGESTELCHKAIVSDGDRTNVILMSGSETQSEGHLVTESAVRGLWKGYRKMMDL